jgi:hypothetical protein
MDTKGGPAGDQEARRHLRARTAALREEIAAYQQAARNYQAGGGTAEARARSRMDLELERGRLRAAFARLEAERAALRG